MLKKSLWSIALCAVGSLGLLLTPGTIEARGGGGGHGGGGGGHGGGGFSRGGGSWGGGGWARGGGGGRGYYGGRGYGYGGRGYGWGGYGIGLGWGGWGYGYPYYDYGYGGYYGSPYYYGSDYNTPGYTYSVPPTYYEQPNYAVPQTGYYGNLQQPAVQQPTNPNAADFTVMVPDPNAQIWFQDYQTKQGGTVREFESANLQPGQTYNFHIRARFMQNGQPVDQVRDVQAKAGQQKRVDFGTPAQK